MKHLRSVLPVLLALMMTFLVACGGGDVAKAPPTYTPEKVAAIQRYMVPIDTARSRMSELEELINKKDGVYVRNFIHGPLGQLRESAGFVTRQLLEKDRGPAKEITDDLFDHLESLDAAAKDNLYRQASAEYSAALKDFDDFLSLIPGE